MVNASAPKNFFNGIMTPAFRLTKNFSRPYTVGPSVQRMVPCQAASTAQLSCGDPASCLLTEDVQKNNNTEGFYKSCFVPRVHDANFCPAEKSLTEQIIKKDFGFLGNLI